MAVQDFPRAGEEDRTADRETDLVLIGAAATLLATASGAPKRASLSGITVEPFGVYIGRVLPASADKQ